MYLAITITVMAVLTNAILPAKTQMKPTADGILLPKVEAKEVSEAKTRLEPLKPVTVPEVVQTTVEVPKSVLKAPKGSCGDNEYARFIYMHESGCQVTSVNSIGCRGIGQACPGSKLPCGADYGCQNAYFTRYALEKYGGWYQAYQFWLVNNWW